MSEATLGGMPPANVGRAPIRRAMTPVSVGEGLVFRGTPTPWQGAYGGDLMTHCSGAARHGRRLGRLISASFEFLRASDPFDEVRASCEVLRAGRSITHIRVTLDQVGSEKLAALLVYETDPAASDAPIAIAPDHEVPQANPDASPPIVEAELAGLPEEFRTYYATARGLDVRYVTKPPYVNGEATGRPEDRVVESKNWTRIVEPTDPGAAFAEAALSYIADDSALEPILNSQGISWLHEDAEIVTLSHSMRFAGPADLGEWLYCTNRLHLTSGRYVETRGTISTSSGHLVASSQQLGIRVGHA